MCCRRLAGKGLACAVWVAFCLACLPAANAAAPSNEDPHAVAVGALADLQSAIDAVVAAEDSYAADPTVFQAAAGRGIDALKRAIGRVEDLVGRGGEQPWVDPLRGAEVNMAAASARLSSAQTARELDDFQDLASEALIGMKAAQGRATELGVFGGLEGALASTVLGVPAGGHRVDACAKPQSAPAWGTHDGYVAWVSVPQTGGVHRLAESPGGTDITLQNGLIVMHTPAAATVAKSCAAKVAAPVSPAPAVPSSHTENPASSSHAENTASPPPGTGGQTGGQTAAAAGGQTGGRQTGGGQTGGQPPPAGQPLPALFTTAQAKAGELVYVRACTACHGINLHGLSAPSVAGSDFLKTAQGNGWSLDVIRYLVVTQMPFNAAGTLSPKEYADVLAYLLASNCFPAGATPFPEQDQPSLAKVALRPRANARQNALGVCPVG